MTWHIDLRLGKLFILQNENYKTVGDALNNRKAKMSISEYL
jgi:hypothetical protein